MKKTVIQPGWQAYFWQYLGSILLIPVFGVGIILLWRLHRQKSSICYEIFDSHIIRHGNELTQRVDLADVSEVQVRRRRIDKFLETGDVILKSPSDDLRIIGQKNPEHLAELIEKAAEAEKIRIAEQHKSKKSAEVTHKPGTLDKLNDLTGLWQQGLISDEEFRKESRHFK